MEEANFAPIQSSSSSMSRGWIDTSLTYVRTNVRMYVHGIHLVVSRAKRMKISDFMGRFMRTTAAAAAAAAAAPAPADCTVGMIYRLAFL